MLRRSGCASVRGEDVPSTTGWPVIASIVGADRRPWPGNVTGRSPPPDGHHREQRSEQDQHAHSRAVLAVACHVAGARNAPINPHEKVARPPPTAGGRVACSTRFRCISRSRRHTGCSPRTHSHRHEAGHAARPCQRVSPKRSPSGRSRPALRCEPPVQLVPAAPAGTTVPGSEYAALLSGAVEGHPCRMSSPRSPPRGNPIHWPDPYE